MSLPKAEQSDPHRVCHQRILQIFEYLKALNDHRNPAVRHIREQPWYMWLDDLPDHPTIEFRLRCGQNKDDEIDAEVATDGLLLRVRRPDLTPCNSPPPEILEWLQAGWDDPENDVHWFDTQNRLNDEGTTQTIRFDDAPERPLILQSWQRKRNEWRLAEAPARKSMQVFQRLYGLHGQLERESERFELVLGDGLLSWQQLDGNIYHPLLIQRVQLVFDAQFPEFRILDADYPPELYTSIFQAVADVDPRMLASCRKEFELGGYHPVSVESTAFLEGLVNQFSSGGKFVPKRRPEPASDHPAIGRGAVLFLRTRTKGFGNAIEQVVQSIEARNDFCEALQNIVGYDTSLPSTEIDAGTNEPTYRELPQHDVLFGREANPEQFRIAKALDRHGAVLVQGPPGTGKSHTIANLIGHLLANGNSVLVTSHTTKALRVLRGHVVEELRPLCVSVLDNDLDSRRQLEESVQAISTRLSESNADELERDAESLDQRRIQLVQRIHELQTELHQARANEYREIVFGGKAYSPADAARQIATQSNDNWIPAPVAPGEPLPLSPPEVNELYLTNKLTNPDDEKFASDPLPESQDLLSPSEFEQSLRKSEELASTKVNDRKLWPGVRFSPTHIDQLRRMVKDFRVVIGEFRRLDGWRLAAVDAGRTSRVDGGPWEHLIGKINEIKELVEASAIDLAKFCPRVADGLPLEVQRVIAKEILDHFSRGGKFDWFRLLTRPQWKKALTSWQTRGHTPSNIEELSAVERLIDVKIARSELSLLWDGLMLPHGAAASAELGDAPERSADQFTAMMRESLRWWCLKIQPLVQRLLGLGFDWGKFLGEQPQNLDRYGEMHRVINAIDSELICHLEQVANHVHSLYLKKRLQDGAAALSRFDRPEVANLRKAIEQNDSCAYRGAYESCLAASIRRKAALRRQDLLGCLTRRTSLGMPLAETWAELIRNRAGLHGDSQPPGDVVAAWEWRMLNDELDRRSHVDLEQLGQQIEQFQAELRKVTNELIDRRAWARQVRRTSLSQRQALMGWLAIEKRRGKRFSVREPQLRRESQRKIGECRSAVPVWIMPLTRVVESFDFSAPRFDVVIIDEASQCDVMALLALAIAKKIVVVGDDMQVSPLAVGQKQAIVDNLIKLHLDGIPNAILYDGKMSVYDLAKQSFPGLICLLEHFRCVPDIIQFSNHLSYNGQIKPLREDASSPLSPHVVPIRVEGNCSSQGKINAKEAVEVASLIVAAIEHEAYQGQTFGVISLIGDEQAIEIERHLLKHLSPEEYERRRIICGNSAQFQGDERSVVFLSMVQTASDGPLPFLDRKEFHQRFNVAASRARNQMWLVYSLSPQTDLKPGDLRRRLIEHALDPGAAIRELERASLRTESPFEKEVLTRLVKRGYRVKPQWRVGSYRIDLVVEGGGKRLAIECDGDRYHPIEKLPEDMERQAILERLGWRFIRLRGTAFFRDPDGTMARVFKRLEELEIPSEGQITEPREQCQGSELIAELIRRAASIRDEWRNAELDENGISPKFRSIDLDPRSTLVPTNDPAKGVIPPSQTNSEALPTAPNVKLIDIKVPDNLASSRITIDHEKRESWQMTLGEWKQLRDGLMERNDHEGLLAIGGLGMDFAHRFRVEQALKEGKPVPKEVLRDYPDLLTNRRQ